MEKRFVSFLLLSVVIMSGYLWLRVVLGPQPPANPAGAVAQPNDEPDPEAEPGGAVQPPNDEKPPEPPDDNDPPDRPEEAPAPVDVASRLVTLGSFDPTSGYRLLVTFNSAGGGIERVELVERLTDGRLRYHDLEDQTGYIGALSTVDHGNGEGCRIRVVGPGTPSALAIPDSGSAGIGLRAGDIVTQVGETPVLDTFVFHELLADVKPGDKIVLRIERETSTGPSSIGYTLEAVERPLQLIQPEPGDDAQLSGLFTFESIGKARIASDGVELKGLPSLRTENWETVVDEAEGGVEFRYRLTPADLQKLGLEGSLEIVKRFRLLPAPESERENPDFAAYHLGMEIEIRNIGDQPQSLAYRLDGPNGLPIEGWWYSNKIGTGWGAVGARDVVWRVQGMNQNVRGCPAIYREAHKHPENAIQTILTDRPSIEERTLDYIGIDTQYFSTMLVPGVFGENKPLLCQQAFSMPVGPVREAKGKETKLVNTSMRIISEAIQLESGESSSQQFTFFLGPKRPKLLAEYELDELIVRGWFSTVSKILSYLLHFLYWIVGNYGVAIVLLTVLVRGCMFPLGRQAAKNAQVMQQMAPEIAKIKEKYKSDLEKQTQAQRELWKKYNFNPLGGCWLMFLQLPIFMGLYRCLSVDIELRQASLIPGLSWCSNLAGPDQLLFWGESFFTNKAGTWSLGPFLNILPIITIVLFLVQQKLFSPPATDDQTRATQRMMTFMMIFMGVMFFKVPSGLCLYFISSSLWGIAERKLLPKPKPPGENDEEPPVAKKRSFLKSGSNGAEKSARDARQRRKRRS